MCLGICMRILWMVEYETELNNSEQPHTKKAALLPNCFGYLYRRIDRNTFSCKVDDTIVAITRCDNPKISSSPYAPPPPSSHTHIFAANITRLVSILYQHLHMLRSLHGKQNKLYLR